MKKKVQEAKRLITEMKQAVKVVEPSSWISSSSNIGPYVRFYYKDGNWFSFEDLENYKIYTRNLKSLFELESEITKTYAEKEFESAFQNIFRKVYENIDDKDIEKFYDEILANPPQDFLIYKPVYGIILNDNNKECALGPISIFHQPTFKHIVENEIKWDKSFLWLGWDSEYMIQVKARARNSKKAEELAAEMLYQFELMVYYAIGRKNEDYGIYIVTGGKHLNQIAIILGQTTVSQPSSLKGPFQKLPLDENYFIDFSIGNNRIWCMIGNNNLSKIELRVLSAIEWIGRANYETDKKTRFLEYMIAIESLFSVSEKVLITPSIANTIVEGLCLLLVEDLAKRLDFDKTFRALYGIRSGIAHGGVIEIKDENIADVSTIAVEAVRKFLCDKRLNSISNPDDLVALLKRLKYGL
ncbi:HEPN domain-containing protein [Leptospira bouyouniensis]|uniref:Apea-like HEPN domain-containing protein n=1 Tax=Leptospira bouyouniensis TaxID=2484911 RepID=A0ABY2L9S6_9LEPT|nr:HEPN domain-containing protein [Leptospira bouyouniensis]TGK54257.1 hypothetical protein EHQ10_00385 [Leptospira bouyouniensis]